jgi:hypothetical protein
MAESGGCRGTGDHDQPGALASLPDHADLRAGDAISACAGAGIPGPACVHPSRGVFMSTACRDVGGSSIFKTSQSEFREEENDGRCKEASPSRSEYASRCVGDGSFNSFLCGRRSLSPAR